MRDKANDDVLSVRFECGLNMSNYCLKWDKFVLRFTYPLIRCHQSVSESPMQSYYLNCFSTGASTPYKRWSKCSMKKIGEGLFGKLEKIKDCNSAFLIYRMFYQK